MFTQWEYIHKTAVRILAETGIRCNHFEMRDRLAGLGCKISGETIFISPDLVECTIQAVPPSFSLYGRSDTIGVLVNASGPFLCTNTGIMPNIYDFDNGTVRRSLRRDVETTTRVLDALSEIDIVYVSLLDATEMPAHLVTLCDMAATLANTTKPLVGPGVTNGSEVRAIIDMAASIRNGDREELKNRPVCAPFICPITPLYFPADITDALSEIALSGLPLTIITNPVMGATAPYTIASNVALGHAEVLASIVMAYTIQSGLPVLSLNTPSVADMRTLASTTGGPETGLMRSLAVEVSRQLGIPSWGHGHTSSTRLDLQASDEKSLNSLLIANARPSLLGGLGGLANVTLTSYETLVLDNERFAALRRIQQGVTVDEEHLAFDVIGALTNGADVISHDHTLRHLRTGEVWRPKLTSRQGLINGQPDRTSSLEKAHAEAKHIMDHHKVEPLEKHIQENIDEIMQKYDRTHSIRALSD